MNILENEGTAYIDQPGQYPVTITEAQQGYDNNSDETVSVVYTADNESTIKCRYTNNKSWGWKLAKLCRACGLTDAQLLNFSTNMLIGKRVMITVKKDAGDKYPNVWEVEAIPADTPMPESVPSTASGTKDDVPF